jgi:hypothetical protein
MFPSATPPMEKVNLALALTPPTVPRLTEDVAWTLATYRQIVALAQGAGRETPSEGDLMGLVGSIAERANQTIETFLRMPEREFSQLACGTGDGITPANTKTGMSPVGDPVLDNTEVAILSLLREKHPVLVRNVDVEVAAQLSKQKVGEVITALIAKDLVIRPQGERKGATLTPQAITLLDRIRKSSTDHP